MKMERKFPTKSSSSSWSSRPMNFFGDPEYKNLTCSETVMGEGGHLAKNEFFANFANSFRKFRNVWIFDPSLDDSRMRI